MLGTESQSVACPIADPGVMSLISDRPHIFVEIDVFLLLPETDSRRAVVSYKWKNVQLLALKCGKVR